MVWRQVAYASIALVSLWVGLAWLARRMIFYPSPYPDGDWNQAQGLGAEDVNIRTTDGTRLHAWWKAAPGSRFATLFLHGNAGNLTHRDDIVRLLPDAGSSVLMLDYRGYGKSEGRPSVGTIVADCFPALAWLERKGYPAARVILHGESLGTAVAMQLAPRQRWAGVVLEAPFTSISDMASTVLPGIGRTLIWGLDSTSTMPALRSPLLIVHGTEDEVVPYRMGQQLFARAPEPKRFLPIANAGHNDLRIVAGDAYSRALRAFYQSLPPTNAE